MMMEQREEVERLKETSGLFEIRSRLKYSGRDSVSVNRTTAPIFADEARTMLDSRKLEQLEHGAMRQLLRRIEELEERLRQLQEAVEEKGERQVTSLMK